MSSINKICPKCGSKNIVKIVYGLPGYELLEETDKDKVRIDRCSIKKNSPEFLCNDCAYEWSEGESS